MSTFGRIENKLKIIINYTNAHSCMKKKDCLQENITNGVANATPVHFRGAAGDVPSSGGVKMIASGGSQ
jgi:hypothetical protein